MSQLTKQSGFTLVELIMVIVIMGVIGGAVAVFMKSPIDAYFDTARRAGIADVADTTVRRMARDIRKALPNSIRLSGTQCIEFIPTRTGGRYRIEDITAGDESSLKFTAADESFNMLGLNSALPADQQIRASGGVNDVIAVYNLGITGVDAYAGNNTAAITGVNVSPLVATETEIQMVGNVTKFPLTSGSNRFHVIPGDEKIVSYICSGGKLYRNANYAYSPSCPAPSATTTPVIATEATCNFAYSAADIRNGLVQLSLTFSSLGESVSIYHEVHVNNTP
ncbi:MAG TPA: type II secretion system protein [Rhodoferax sp.]|jgi:MSHA biogenesis protein MshO|nr:type II secretion system protein [Rhodoferax sp.]HNV59018.1 type II secretion system protein [Rhodoferax sp.]HPW29784.1 type II secretion system protein [Rhodoferax sp.]